MSESEVQFHAFNHIHSFVPAQSTPFTHLDPPTHSNHPLIQMHALVHLHSLLQVDTPIQIQPLLQHHSLLQINSLLIQIHTIKFTHINDSSRPSLVQPATVRCSTCGCKRGLGMGPHGRQYRVQPSRCRRHRITMRLSTSNTRRWWKSGGKVIGVLAHPSC